MSNTHRLIVSEGISFTKGFVAVDLTDDQVIDMNVHNDFSPAFIDGIGSLPIATYKVYPGSNGEYSTRSPIKQNQIKLYSPNFWLANYHGSCQRQIPIPGISSHGESAILTIRPGAPFVDPNVVWEDPWNFSIEVDVRDKDCAHLDYAAAGQKYLEIYTRPKNLVPDFIQFITNDETGILQNPSPEVLERRVSIAKERAARLNVGVSNLSSFIYDYGRKPYFSALEAARNIAARMDNPQPKVAVDEIEQIYQNTVSTFLQSKLGEFLPKLRRDISEAFVDTRGSHSIQDLYVQINFLLNFAREGKITLDENAKKQIVSNRLLLGKLQHSYENVDNKRARDEVESYRSRIEELNREIEGLKQKISEEKDSLASQKSSARFNRGRINESLLEDLAQIGVSGNIGDMMREVKPDEIAPRRSVSDEDYEPLF